MLVKDSLHSHHVFLAAHERVGDEVDVLFYCEQDVRFVLFSQRRQVDMLSRNVDALFRTQLSVVLHLYAERVAVFFIDEHIQFSVVEEHVVAHFHVVNEILV